MAPVILALKKHRNIACKVCVTGQHKELLSNALSVFDIVPDIDLSVMQTAQSLADLTARVLTKVSQVIADYQPDRVLVHGDTTTTFAAALACFYAEVPIGHVEAGLRTNNIRSPWPEEFNRRVTDSISDRLWAPTQSAAAALRQEGADPNSIIVTGNTVIDALKLSQAKLQNDEHLRQKHAFFESLIDPEKRMILVTSHRRENQGDGLITVCAAVRQLAEREDVDIIWPVHPNPAVLNTVRSELANTPHIVITEAKDYLSFVALMMRASVILTDSGGIQEEAPALGKPVLVMREETERPEAIEAGTARLVGTSATAIVEKTNLLLDDTHAYEQMAQAINPFGDGHAAQRIVQDLEITHGLATSSADSES